MRYVVAKQSTESVSKEINGYMASHKIGCVEMRLLIGTSQATLRKVMDGKPLTDGCLSRIKSALASLAEEKPAEPKTDTLIRFGKGFVFVCGKDEPFMSESERASVKSANLRKGTAYYRQGNVFIAMGESK